MVCLGLEPGAAGWKAQTNPLSYGGIHLNTLSQQIYVESYKTAPFPIRRH